MKQTLLLALVVASVTACSKPEEAPAPAPATQPSVGVSATSGSGPATTAVTAPPVIDTSKIGPPPAASPGIDLDAGGEKRMPNGNLAQDNLELLNGLVAHLNEGRGTWSTDATPVFKNEQEKLAYDEAVRKMKEPITDLEELVKARLIKKIPAAPAGKKYVINPTTHKVELANQ